MTGKLNEINLDKYVIYSAKINNNIYATEKGPGCKVTKALKRYVVSVFPVPFLDSRRRPSMLCLGKPRTENYVNHLPKVPR